jgi:hypothetical protein
MAPRLNLVRKGAQGVTIHRDWDALGQRGTDSGTVTFERGEIERTRVAAPIYAAKSTASRAAVRATSEIYALMGARSVPREWIRPFLA